MGSYEQFDQFLTTVDNFRICGHLGGGRVGGAASCVMGDGERERRRVGQGHAGQAHPSDDAERVVPATSGSFTIIESRVPRPGVDYPECTDDFARLYPDETAARRFLEEMRFPSGFVCEHCGERGEPWRSGTGLLACVSCRQPTVLTQGTLFDGSTVALKRWLRVLWEATDREQGIGVKHVAALAGVQQPMAATMLATIRGLMRASAQAPLSGDVQMTTARLEIGDDRPAVALAWGRDSAGKERVRLRALSVVSSREIVRFVVNNVRAGSKLVTNEWRGFAAVRGAGYAHRLASDATAHADAENVLATLRLWLWSHEDVSVHNLDACLDDFAFRFNRRDYPRGLLFYRLMILASATGPRSADGTLATG